MIYKKRILSFSVYFLLISLSILISILFYDPLQVFHKSFFTDDRIFSNMRINASGIIDNYDFDSIILGTSMLENTSSNEASELLGGKFANISLSGSDFFERYFVLNYALNSKKIKKVIYSLDSVYLSQREGYPSYPPDSFLFLYDKNPFNDIKAYLNPRMLAKTYLSLFGIKKVGKKMDLDRPSAWYEIKYHSERFGGLDNWFAAKNNSQIISAFKEITNISHHIQKKVTIPLKNIEEKKELAKKYISKYILKLVENNPDTQFILIFPPYSRIKYAGWIQYDLPSFEIHKEAIKYLSKSSKKYNNLEVYGFENQDFLDKISYYKDTTHYHYAINSWMLKQISEKKSILKEDMIEDYIHEISKKAQKFDLISISDRIEFYIKSFQSQEKQNL